MYFQLSSGKVENMTTHEFAQLISGIIRILEKLPDIPLAELRTIVDRTGEKHSRSVQNLIYKGVPAHISQKGNFDEWSAYIEWYGHLMEVDLEEMELPTHENVMLATHRLINILTDIRDKGVIYPDSYFISK